MDSEKKTIWLKRFVHRTKVLKEDFHKMQMGSRIRMFAGLCVVCIAHREETSLLQVSKALRWQSPRDLAIVPPEQKISLTADLELSFFSVVPTFGPDGNYIALLHYFSRPIISHLEDPKNGLYCSGANRAHLIPLRLVEPGHDVNNRSHGMNFFCDWPAEEAHLENFEVYLEDARGRALGSVVAQRKPGLLQQYGTAACVRDLFFDTEGQSGYNSPFELLPQWLEFSKLHGVDHFFVYTFEKDDETLKELLTPYLERGWASRIHFQKRPSLGQRQTPVIEDCLFRAKGHAKWLFPSLDVDEYLRPGPTFAHSYGGGEVPQNYMSSAWGKILSVMGKKESDVGSITFGLYRYKPAASGELAISSVWRAFANGGSPFPKYVANVQKVSSLWIHWVDVFEDGAEDIFVEKAVMVANHYRVLKPNKPEPNFHIYDNTTSLESAQLIQRLESRFAQPDNTKSLEGAQLIQSFESRFAQPAKQLLERLGKIQPNLVVEGN